MISVETLNSSFGDMSHTSLELSQEFPTKYNILIIKTYFSLVEF